MPTENGLLKVHFDTNVYYHIKNYSEEAAKTCPDLIRPDEYDFLKSKVGQKFLGFDAPTNVVEIAKDDATEHETVKSLLRISFELCGDNMLPDPVQLSREEINSKLRLGLPVDDLKADYLGIKRAILSDAETDPTGILIAYDTTLTDYCDGLNIFRVDFIKEACKSEKRPFDRDKYVGTMIGILDGEPPEFIIPFKRNYLIRNKILETDGVPFDSLDTLSCFFLYKTFYKALLYKIIQVGTKVKVNDYLDEEQVLYLDSIDYLIAKDNKFKDTYNTAFGGTPYGSKFITVREFINKIK